WLRRRLRAAMASGIPAFQGRREQAVGVFDDIKAVGLFRDHPPTPADPEHTTYVPAGPLSVGLEYREGGSDHTIVNFADMPGQMQELIEEFKRRDRPTVDRGFSFHVCDAATGVEHLRFDAFDSGPDSQGPHYHYLHHSDAGMVTMTVVRYDEDAQGPM